MSNRVRWAVAVGAASLIVATALPAQASVPGFTGDGSIGACLEERTPEVQTDGCYEMALAPSSTANAKVKISWDLNTTAEGFDNSMWEGGLWMQRWPIEGQWKKYPPEGETFPAGKVHEDCVAPNINTSNCYRVYSGAKGSLILEFPPSMAGYVYEVYGHDNICSVDGSSCGPSGGMVGGNTYPYVFIFKAYRFKDRKGNYVVQTACPPASKRKSSCKPAAAGQLARSIGASPVTPP